MNFLFTVPDQPSREFEERVKIEIHRQRGIMLLNPDDHAAQDDLNQVIRLVIRKHKRKHGMSVIGRFSDDFIAHVITTCLDIDNKTLFLDSVDVCSDWAFSLASQLVGAALLRYDLESSLPK